LLSMLFVFLGWYCIHRGSHSRYSYNTVPLKYQLTSLNYWGTVISIRRLSMAPFLNRDKQVVIISALAEGSGIRQIEMYGRRSPRHDRAAWRSCR
jgi:hypothetical protein